MTYKLVYFKLLCEVLELVIAKEHLIWAGLLKILLLKAHFKNGLMYLIIENFPNFTPVSRFTAKLKS